MLDVVVTVLMQVIILAFAALFIAVAPWPIFAIFGLVALLLSILLWSMRA